MKQPVVSASNPVQDGVARVRMFAPPKFHNEGLAVPTDAVLGGAQQKQVPSSTLFPTLCPLNTIGTVGPLSHSSAKFILQVIEEMVVKPDVSVKEYPNGLVRQVWGRLRFNEQQSLGVSNSSAWVAAQNVAVAAFVPAPGQLTNKPAT